MSMRGIDRVYPSEIEKEFGIGLDGHTILIPKTEKVLKFPLEIAEVSVRFYQQHLDRMTKWYDYLVYFSVYKNTTGNKLETFERGKSYDLSTKALEKMSMVGVERVVQFLRVAIEELVTVANYRRLEDKNAKGKGN